MVKLSLGDWIENYSAAIPNLIAEAKRQGAAEAMECMMGKTITGNVPDHRCHGHDRPPAMGDGPPIYHGTKDVLRGECNYSAAIAASNQEDRMSESFPRRNRVDLMTPAELAIRNTVFVVEEAGADPLLTEAVVLLQQARDKVADYVDKNQGAEPPKGTRTPGPWHYQEDSDAYTHIVRGPKNQHVVQFRQDTSGVSEADARMAAAAPDLLEALRELLEVSHHDCGESQGAHLMEHLAPASLKASAAIRKVNRESE